MPALSSTFLTEGMQNAAAKGLLASLQRDKGAMIVGQGMAHLKPDLYPTPDSAHQNRSIARGVRLAPRQTPLGRCKGSWRP